MNVPSIVLETEKKLAKIFEKKLTFLSGGYKIGKNFTYEFCGKPLCEYNIGELSQVMAKCCLYSDENRSPIFINIDRNWEEKEYKNFYKEENLNQAIRFAENLKIGEQSAFSFFGNNFNPNGSSNVVFNFYTLT